MKTYTTKANARRAARTQITDVEKPVEGTHYTIEEQDGKFGWRRVQVAPKAPAPEAQAELVPAPKAKPTPEQLFTAQRAPTFKECIEHGHKVKQAIFSKETAPKATRLTKEEEAHLFGTDKKDAVQAKGEAKGNHKVRRSGAVAAIWELCEANKDLRRKDVINLCVQKGYNFYTARTQYQEWFKASKNSQTK